MPDVSYHPSETIPIRQTKISEPGSGQFVKTHLLLTAAQKNKLLRKLKNPVYHWTTACCTSVLQQNLLPAYKHVLNKLQEKPQDAHLNQSKQLLDGMYDISSLFIEVERYINNPFYTLDENFTVADCLNNLDGFLDEFLSKLPAKLQLLSLDENKCSKKLEALKEKIEKRVSNFQEIIKNLKGKKPPPTFIEVKELFKMRHAGWYGESLGLLSAHCMKDILKAGRDIAYEMTDRPIRYSFFVSKAVEAFSDADAQITKKMFSLSGTEHIIIDPISDDVIESLVTSDEEVANPNKKSWFPVSEYLSSEDNIEELDEIIHISPPPKLYSIPTSIKLWTASFIEFPFAAIGFLASHLFLTPLGLVEQYFYQNSPTNWTTRASQSITAFFHEYSPVRRIKKTARDEYLAAIKKDSYSDIRDTLTDQPKSFFASLLEYYSPEKTVEFILKPRKQRFYIPLWEDLQHVFGIFSYKESPESIYERVISLAKPIKENTELANKLKDKNNKNASKKLNKAEWVEVDNRPIKEIEDEFASPSACKTPLVKSPLRIPKVLIEHLADNSLDEAFRKAPVVMTVWSLLSAATGLSFFVPGIPLALQPMFQVLQHIPDKLGVLVSNQAHHMVAEDVVGSFIESVLGAEGAKAIRECIKGKKTKLSHHEETIMALYLTIALALAMQTIPLLPTHVHLVRHTFNDPYTDILDFVIEDFVNERTPVGAFEIVTTGLAIGLKACSILLTKHRVPRTEVQAFIRKLNEKDVFNDPFSEKAHADFDAVLKNAFFSEAIKNELRIGFYAQVLTSRTSIETTVSEEPISWVQTATREPVLSPDAVKKEASAYEKLKEALELLDYVTFDRTAEALQFYNHLSYLFKQYNKSLAIIDRKDLRIDFQPILNDFYNLHCYKGSLVAFRLFYLMPFTVPFPLVPLWRLIKWTVGGIKNDPALQHQVWKSFCKEGLMIGQCLSPINRLGLAGLRAATYLTRFTVGLALALPAASLNISSIYQEGFVSRLKTYGVFLNTKIVFHRTTSWTFEKYFWEPVRSIFTNAAIMASTNNNLSETIKHTLILLGKEPAREKITIAPIVFPPVPPRESNVDEPAPTPNIPQASKKKDKNCFSHAALCFSTLFNGKLGGHHREREAAHTHQPS
jgi:hypothetical protein